MKKIIVIGLILLFFVIGIIAAFASGWFISQANISKNDHTVSFLQAADAVNCKSLSSLVSNDLAKELKSRADSIIIDKVGKDDFDKYYNCSYIGFNYVRGADGSALLKYATDYNYHSAFIYMSVVYEIEMKDPAVDDDKPTTLENELNKKRYFDVPVNEDIDIFYNNAKYPVETGNIYIVFVGITPDLRVSTPNFPTYQKYQAANISKTDAIETAKTLAKDKSLKFLEYDGTYCTLADASLAWDSTQARFYWSIVLPLANNKCIHATVWADQKAAPRVIVDKYLDKVL